MPQLKLEQINQLTDQGWSHIGDIVIVTNPTTTTDQPTEKATMIVGPDQYNLYNIRLAHTGAHLVCRAAAFGPDPDLTINLWVVASGAAIAADAVDLSQVTPDWYGLVVINVSGAIAKNGTYQYAARVDQVVTLRGFLMGCGFPWIPVVVE